MIGDFLKKFRDADYKKEKPVDAGGGEEEENPDQKTRSLSLTDDEIQAFKGIRPGEDLACEVHGSLGADGNFQVLSVAPLNQEKGYGSEQEMAGQVAQRVTPSVQLSPS